MKTGYGSDAPCRDRIRNCHTDPRLCRHSPRLSTESIYHRRRQIAGAAGDLTVGETAWMIVNREPTTDPLESVDRQTRL
jgi:hypothetical protein